MTRVAVFIDYQNVYMGARSAFGDPNSLGDFRFGQVLPLQLGILLTDLGKKVDPERELTQVRVYRGEPDAKRSRAGQAACQRQVQSWNREQLVEATTRPLHYRETAWDEQGTAIDWQASEKGIDVLLAIDMTLGAVNKDYDVAVLFSADSDLVPALEAVLQRGKRVEVAGWKPDRGYARRIGVKGRNIWGHQLDRELYESVRDDIDYTRDVPNIT